MNISLAGVPKIQNKEAHCSCVNWANQLAANTNLALFLVRKMLMIIT
jgi:hypothetical protein